MFLLFHHNFPHSYKRATWNLTHKQHAALPEHFSTQIITQSFPICKRFFIQFFQKTEGGKPRLCVDHACDLLFLRVSAHADARSDSKKSTEINNYKVLTRKEKSDI
ncbi:MAG: hypothetical protein LUC50_09270, partial [Ruminococcus sp.]|nr:hypothetical protein [Ruminococcus sp.]